MVIPDEVRALQLEKAEEVEREWSALQGMVQERLAGHKELQVTIDREITQDEIAATDLGSNVTRARDRIARLKAGENVAGIDKPLTPAEMGFSGSAIWCTSPRSATPDSKSFSPKSTSVSKRSNATSAPRWLADSGVNPVCHDGVPRHPHEHNFALNSDQPYMAAAYGAYSAGCAGSTARWPSRLQLPPFPPPRRRRQHRRPGTGGIAGNIVPTAGTI